MSLPRTMLALAAAAWLLAIGAAADAAGPARTIVLIGGNTPHGPLVHDAQNGILRIERYLRTSPEIRASGKVTIKAYPKGWPDNPDALDDAATIVWYFDGLEHHPLLDGRRRARFETLMRRGVGLVTFHQASTLPPDDRTIDLGKWLGAARYGMVDRTTETVAFKPAEHPISRGVKPFTYRDEFYPTLRFGDAPVAPILSGWLHLEAAPAAPPTERRVAWAFERPGGGRSFGFTGFHYLAALDQPDLRKLLLNAIVWTAGLEVPSDGVSVRDGKSKVRSGQRPRPFARSSARRRAAGE
jgi:hypothetical protein